MLYYIKDINEFNNLKRNLSDRELFIEKVDEESIKIYSNIIRGEVDKKILGSIIVDLMKYIDTIYFNWRVTIPSFNIKEYPQQPNLPRSIIRYSGKIIGINPFIQRLIGGIVESISRELKHKNISEKIISIDFIENSH
ncbi:hypothetical protein DRP43_03700 [candidate division TA06 bacterium]|uniref:Uncharacterized protein n=1 Tax=candidate division TA06 bacterium TaxID=2250710 RepID=A0A660SH55_UNCT6|nr:MAG: hypothetical protein DRP43_03700 [candidate division TA06 bacterium]